MSKKWYKAMGDGAAAAGSYVSYCGMTPRVLMNSVSIAASTHARASHDYVPGQVRFLALIDHCISLVHTHKLLMRRFE